MALDVVHRVLNTSATDASPILLRARRSTPSSKALHLVATDSEAFFDLQSSNPLTHKTPSTKDDSHTWPSLLSHILFHDPLPDSRTFEIAAQPSPAKITILLRECLPGGIKPRLAAFDLRQNDTLLDQEDLFEWTAVAAQRHAEAQLHLCDKIAQLAQQERAVAALKTRLEDLCQAKKEHEDSLLEKCRRLINSKKLKIREQQRLLRGAQIDAGAVEAAKQQQQQQQQHGGERRQREKVARPAKRANAEVDKEDGDESEPGFESGEETAPGSDHSMERDNDDDDDDDDDEAEQRAEPPKQADEVPPPRSLPFNSKRTAPAERLQNDSTDTEDDEL